MYHEWAVEYDVWLKPDDDPDGNFDNDNDDGHTGSGAVQTRRDDDEPKGGGAVEAKDDPGDEGRVIRMQVVVKNTFPLSHHLPTRKSIKVGK